MKGGIPKYVKISVKYKISPTDLYWITITMKSLIMNNSELVCRLPIGASCM